MHRGVEVLRTVEGRPEKKALKDSPGNRVQLTGSAKIDWVLWDRGPGVNWAMGGR